MQPWAASHPEAPTGGVPPDPSTRHKQSIEPAAPNRPQDPLRARDWPFQITGHVDAQSIPAPTCRKVGKRTTRQPPKAKHLRLQPHPLQAQAAPGRHVREAPSSYPHPQPVVPNRPLQRRRRSRHDARRVELLSGPVASRRQRPDGVAELQPEVRPQLPWRGALARRTPQVLGAGDDDADEGGGGDIPFGVVPGTPRDFAVTSPPSFAVTSPPAWPPGNGARTRGGVIPRNA